jgi:hypothetical protein
MTLRDLIELFRNEVDDTVEPYLWSDDEATDFANDAQQEACRRARLLVDSTTTAICQVTAAAADAGLVTLDPRVIFLRRIRASGSLPLKRMTLQDMEECNPYWQDSAADVPRAFIPDYSNGVLMLWPKPATDTVYAMTVVREPLAEMDSDDDEPEIPTRWQRSLRHWMVFRAYSKQDTEALDPKKAGQALALFEQEFGAKSSAIDETWIAREQFDHDGTF